ncbi:MAG: NAD-dependent epimerase/dehydratase family protein [Pirellulales bacterium]|nr:NAD-dependent epimerase/dehydratase family protein [Pirellulales bacterium]
MSSSCLITGATGFVGSNLARLLRREGWDVRCLVRSSSKLDQIDSLGCEIVRGSLDDDASLSAAVTGVDVVFHLAGRTAALRASEFTRDNVEGTRLLAQACAAQPNPPVLVMISSLAAGGPGTLISPRRECDPERPVSSYGRSKLAAEQAAVAVSNNLPVSIVRPPMVFGQADRASLTIFRGMKFLPVHPNPGLRRFPISLVHVSDLCDALLRVADRGERATANGAPGATAARGKYYVAADRNITYGELGQIAATAAGWTVGTLPLPRPIFWIAGSIGEVLGRIRQRPAVLNFDKVREASAVGWVCCDEKIRTELGYQPSATLEQHYKETVAWYREHGWL